MIFCIVALVYVYSLCVSGPNMYFSLLRFQRGTIQHRGGLRTTLTILLTLFAILTSPVQTMLVWGYTLRHWNEIDHN